MGRLIDLPAMLEDLAFLAETNVGLAEAAARTGFTSRNNLDKWLRNHGQHELLNRLIGHERQVA